MSSKEFLMITDIQKSVLKRYYNDSMAGMGSKFQSMIAKAAVETGLSVERVEVDLMIKPFME